MVSTKTFHRITLAPLRDDVVLHPQRQYHLRSQESETNWGNNAFQTYLLLEPGTDAVKLESEFWFLDWHYGPFAKSKLRRARRLRGLETHHFVPAKSNGYSSPPHLDDEIEVNGNISNVPHGGNWSLFIVLIACFNFVNLSTARHQARQRSRHAQGSWCPQEPADLSIPQWNRYWFASSADPGPVIATPARTGLTALPAKPSPAARRQYLIIYRCGCSPR